MGAATKPEGFAPSTDAKPRPEYRRQANWMLSLIKRQALHAKKLRFAHPITEEMMEFTAPLPEDLRAVLEAARMESE